MSAHTVATSVSMGNNLSGTKQVRGTMTGSASYDTNGSICNMVTAPGDKIRNTTDVGFFSDPAGNYIAEFVPGASNGAALGKVKCYYGQPLAATATMDYSGACFDAAATTDSDTIFTQPANSLLVGFRLNLDEAFVATSMTAMTWVLGLSGDTNGLGTGGTSDLVADAVNSGDNTMGAYMVGNAGYHTVAALPWLLAPTSTGANLSTLSAGQITVTYYYYPDVPTGLKIGGPGVSEVASTADLSGTTFNYIVTGTDG